MPTIKALFNRTVRSFNRMHFDRACRAVLDTPPIAVGIPEGARMVSMLRHTDVLMYLAAVKSFASRVPVADIHIVNDGSLLDEDRATLATHLPGVRIHEDLRAFQSPRCPVGGTWERLLAIAELSKDAYVIQLDADTLTIGDIPEVQTHVAERRSFTIGTWDKQQIDTMTAASQLARKTLAAAPSEHVQSHAEAAFDQIPDFAGMNYVRGCSGFMGFAPGSVDRARIEAWSAALEASLGPVWSTWGSEQVMANIVVANTSGAAVLPHPKYCNCERIDPLRTAFIHFVGSCRFKGPAYASHLSETIAQLSPATS